MHTIYFNISEYKYKMVAKHTKSYGQKFTAAIQYKAKVMYYLLYIS